MLIRYVKDITMASADVVSGGTGPFLTAPTLDQIIYTVNDQTPTTAAIVGKTLVVQLLASNAPGGANFASNLVAQAGVGRGMAGVVQSAATAVGNEARIVVEGPCKAYATSTANTNKAIAIGDPLTLDGAGNLTSAAANPGAAGTVVGFALQALAGGTATPTLINVLMGGY